MKPSTVLEFKRDVIRAVVARHNASNARVFGSVVHGKDNEGSDLDILIDPTPETPRPLKMFSPDCGRS